MEEKIIELNNKIECLEKRVNLLEDFNKTTKVRKRIYYSLLIIGSIIVVVSAYFVFKSTYGAIIDYLK